MLVEISCGAVIYKIKKNNPMFLLVYSKRNKEWGFPKGHIENDETEKETAIREIYEETGIKNIDFIQDFRSEETYTIIGKREETLGQLVEKHSILFLARAVDEPQNKIDDEIEKVKWLAFKLALKLLKFDAQKKILKAAYEKIGGS